MGEELDGNTILARALKEQVSHLLSRSSSRSLISFLFANIKVQLSCFSLTGCRVCFRHRWIPGHRAGHGDATSWPEIYRNEEWAGGLLRSTGHWLSYKEARCMFGGFGPWLVACLRWHGKRSSQLLAIAGHRWILFRGSRRHRWISRVATGWDESTLLQIRSSPAKRNLDSDARWKSCETGNLRSSRRLLPWLSW